MKIHPDHPEVQQFGGHLSGLGDAALVELVRLADDGQRNQLQTLLIYREAAQRFARAFWSEYYKGEVRW